MEKLGTKVNFPLQKLSMARWLTGTQAGTSHSYCSGSTGGSSKTTSPDYDLYAIANHHSFSASGGHYTAYIQSKESPDVWVECNDQSLRGLGPAEVVTEKAYLLFYKRRVLSASNIINLTYHSFT